MRRRIAAFYRRAAGSPLRTRLAVVALLGVVGSAVLLARPGAGTVDQAASQPAVSQAAAAAPVPAAALAVSAPTSAVRRIYPHSIIPGGVSSREELARVIKTDKVVAAHYASFNVDKSYPVTVTKPRAVYVSYRKGDKVYWTAKKLMLAEGETLFSDGVNEMRARCANRISDIPMLPVAADEPSEEELDSSTVQEETGAGSIQSIAADETGEAEFTGRPFDLQIFPQDAGLSRPEVTLATRADPEWPPVDGPDFQIPPSIGQIGSVSNTPIGGKVTDPAPRPPGAPDAPRPVVKPPPDPTPRPGPPPSTPGPQKDPTPFTPEPPLGPPFGPPGPPGPPDPPVFEKPEDPAEVPEPGTLWLAAVAGAAMLLGRRRRRALSAA